MLGFFNLFSSYKFIGILGIIIVILTAIYYFYSLGGKLTECRIQNQQLQAQLETIGTANEIQNAINGMSDSDILNKLRRDWGSP